MKQHESPAMIAGLSLGDWTSAYRARRVIISPARGNSKAAPAPPQRPPRWGDEAEEAAGEGAGWSVEAAVRVETGAGWGGVGSVVGGTSTSGASPSTTS